MCAALVTEPFHLRPWEIARLTDYQIREIYFHKRRDDGSIDDSAPVTVDEEQPGSQSWEFIVKEVWKDRGKTPEEQEVIWQQYLVDNPHLTEGR